jgi:hypothetical protein
VDLGDILAGKRVRPAAWTMDIFVRNVRDALQAVGVAGTMDPQRENSITQNLAGELAAAAGLPDQGELFKQMQRARKIEIAGGPTCPKRPVLIMGTWQVPQ